MKRARFAYNGQVHDAVFEHGQLWVGTIAYDPEDVMWLPPVAHTGKAIGVALGYKDHAAELDLELPDEPILFQKMASSYIGHGAQIVAPAGIDYMHYECELVAVMGLPARKVSADDALRYVSGYTIGNDVTVRDFVTNYFRPPIKAKGFDTFGPIGPYLVCADEVDPANVGLRTYVNGELRQKGNTKNLRHSVAELIEYITDYMTLNPGDMIWSGTPEGISHIYPGDTVRLEVDGLGVLENKVIEA
ncbi:MAG: 2-hydroxyhepta-2,4-diene-1,7-dioate isomerase [Candidatus Latescibacteria bacterium]|jgi:5-oxopent-3-ene-1,2,5-tricarboxylate decarboxylase / 2-hydroxyhepta-2,4-diene-1,7-dioate isomerase|nr:2-hydroxyhepta-2,4-diene-1,7-dioate isomerase [Candidatus Latescibacterota bacterium]